jgi:hypothetical protein
MTTFAFQGIRNTALDNDIGFSRRVRRHRCIPYTGLLLSYDKISATGFEVLLMVGLCDEQEDYVKHLVMNETDEKEKKKRLSLIVVTSKRMLKARVPTLASSAEFRWAFPLEKLVSIEAKELTDGKVLVMRAYEKSFIGSGDSMVEKNIRVDSADVGRVIMKEVNRLIKSYNPLFKPKAKAVAKK